MSATSKIEWTDATWNPLRGCTRIASGCVNCYAERMAARGLPGLNSPTTGNPFAVMTPSGPRWTGKVELIASQVDQPFRWRKGRRIFVNSISDTFYERVPDYAIDRIFSVMASCPQHTFMVLTKRAKRMFDWATSEPFMFDMEYSPNVWLGVSASTRPDLDAQIEHLRATPAAVRFLSLEPLIADLGTIDLSGIGWVIVGGESGPGARPMHPDWVRSVRDQCVAAGVKFFFKQWGEWAPSEVGEDSVIVPGLVPDGSVGPDRCHWLWPDGAHFPVGVAECGMQLPDPEVLTLRVGKKAAGRLLDGREWNELPGGPR